MQTESCCVVKSGETTFSNAIDKAVDVVDRQIEKYKSKLQNRRGAVIREPVELCLRKILLK